jgi:phosphate transport system substrate-binding protein
VIKNKMSALAGCVVVALGIAACGSSSSSTSSSSSPSATISGAGSTFAAPVYEQWASSLSPLTVNYQAVGSGAGITALESKTVDFGASDPPLKPEDEEAIAKNGSPAVQIPMFLGAITVSYNVPGVQTGLKLDGKTISDIYLGKVKTWNDAEIKALNPGVNLPSTAITTIHRSDSSGTTSGFTSFLAAVDPEFKSKVGEGKDVQWPVGTGAKGNAGVAGAVQQTAGAVGYVEQAYALQHHFTYASVKNKAGNFVAPSLASSSTRTSARPGHLVAKRPPKAWPSSSNTDSDRDSRFCLRPTTPRFPPKFSRSPRKRPPACSATAPRSRADRDATATDPVDKWPWMQPRSQSVTARYSSGHRWLDSRIARSSTG